MIGEESLLILSHDFSRTGRKLVFHPISLIKSNNHQGMFAPRFRAKINSIGAKRSLPFSKVCFRRCAFILKTHKIFFSSPNYKSEGHIKPINKFFLIYVKEFLIPKAAGYWKKKLKQPWKKKSKSGPEQRGPRRRR